MPATEAFDKGGTIYSFYPGHNEQWVIEGCYGDLILAALPSRTELRFLNPGIEACVALFYFILRADSVNY